MINLSNENKVLLKNYSSLTILQIANYIFPLISFPYLVRVLGPEKYGLVNFVIAFATYFSMFTDYGFNISATQSIAINRDNETELRKIFWTVFFTKFLLLAIASFVFFSLVFLIGKFSSYSTFYVFAYLTVVGAMFFPQWFFQGTEKMHYITEITVLVKTFWLAGVFFLIRSPNDAADLVLLNGLSVLIIGVLGFVTAIKSFEIKFYLPHFSELISLLKKGKYVFLSTASISLYTNSNVFILGLIAGNEAAGYFAAADKIRIAIQGLFNNAATAVFPRVSRLFNESLEKVKKFLDKYLLIIWIAGILVSIFGFLFSQEIIDLLLGEKYVASVGIFKVLAFLPLIIVLSNFYGIQIMLNKGFDKEFLRIVFSAGLINILLAVIFSSLYGAIGSAVAVLIAEIFVTLSMWFFVENKHLLKNQERQIEQ